MLSLPDNTYDLSYDKNNNANEKEGKKMTLTVKEVHEIIQIMKSIYNFSDSNTLIDFEDPYKCPHDQRHAVSIRAFDERTGVEVTLTKEIPMIKSEEEKDDIPL